MNLVDIAYYRLINQQIERPKFKAVKEMVGWMGALQAQDYGMAKWAIGLRLPNTTDQLIETAINNGEIIRTHLLRPTWHFISAGDIYWMLALRAAPIKASFRSRLKQLGLSESMIAASNRIIENVLRGGKHLTREELLPELTKAGIPIDENRASHLLVRAEMDGLVCSGPIKRQETDLCPAGRKSPENKSSNRRRSAGKAGQNIF